MKNRKKIKGFCLSVVFLLANVMTAFAWGNTSQSSVFQERLTAIQANYPTGYSLGANFTYDASWQCVAYAKKVCYEVFKTKWSTWEKHTRTEDPNLDNLSVGDYLLFDRTDGQTHSIFITKIEGDQIYFTDANWIHPNVVRWDVSISKHELLTNPDRFYNSYRHAPNYADIFPTKSETDYKEEWVKTDDGNGWRYRIKTGEFLKNQFLDLGRDKKYYFDANTVMVSNKWVEDSGKRYHAAADGHMDLGWQNFDGNWYYFNDPSGDMKVNGWEEFEGKKYYLSAEGPRYQNISKVIEGKKYEFNSEGAAKEVEYADGWIENGQNWQYLLAASGLAKNQFVDLGRDKKYFFDNDCLMIKNDWVNVGGKYYHASADGHMDLGWQNFDGNWYYFNDPDGDMKVNGWETYNGKKYYLGGNGVRYQNTTKNIDNKYYHFDSEGAAEEISGDMAGDLKEITSTSDKSTMKPVQVYNSPRK